MHRIDSINARPNQNGASKNGFNSNADLPGADATYLTPDWCNAVQEELLNAIGLNASPNKNNNGQLAAVFQEMDSRLSTAIVTLGAAMQQAIINERNAERNRVWPIGKGRFTTYDGLNPAHASHLGWGEWELDTAMAGRVLVGAGQVTDSVVGVI